MILGQVCNADGLRRRDRDEDWARGRGTEWAPSAVRLVFIADGTKSLFVLKNLCMILNLWLAIDSTKGDLSIFLVLCLAGS